MNKLLLLLLVVGLIYILCSPNISENMSNSNIFVSVSKKFKYEDNTMNQYAEFIDDNKDVYVMINYDELTINQKTDIINAVEKNNLKNLKKYLCHNKNDNKDACLNYKSLILPVFFINIKDKKYTDSIIGLKSVTNQNKNHLSYTSLVPLNAKVDFDKKKINDVTLLSNASSLHFNKNNELVISKSGLKASNKNDLNNIKLNKFVLDDKNKTKLYYPSK